MSNKVAARAELGNDASFMSTSFRTMFTAVFPARSGKGNEIVL